MASFGKGQELTSTHIDSCGKPGRYPRQVERETQNDVLAVQRPLRRIHLPLELSPDAVIWHYFFRGNNIGILLSGERGWAFS